MLLPCLIVLRIVTVLLRFRVINLPFARSDMLHHEKLVLHALLFRGRSGPNTIRHMATVRLAMIVIELGMKRIMRDCRRTPSERIKCRAVSNFISGWGLVSPHPATLALLNAAHVVRNDGVGVRIPRPQKKQGLVNLVAKSRRTHDFWVCRFSAMAIAQEQSQRLTRGKD